MTNNTRHVKNRYFGIKDRIDKGEIQVMYCPTELMLADYFTKPLQGSLFRRFREIIMGYESIDSIISITDSIKERVGNDNISENELVIENVTETDENVNTEITDGSKQASYAEVVKRKVINVNRALNGAHKI